MRLRALYKGELTLREFGVLVRGLPPTSRLRLALGDGQPPWTATDYLLADVYDALAAGNWQRSGGPKQKYPKPYPRPGSRRRAKDTPERAAALASARERARERQRALAAGEIT